jgi:hypothetical protein
MGRLLVLATWGNPQGLTALELYVILPSVPLKTAEKKGDKFPAQKAECTVAFCTRHFASGLWEEANYPLEGDLSESRERWQGERAR